jgi:hypothetical protein
LFALKVDPGHGIVPKCVFFLFQIPSWHHMQSLFQEILQSTLRQLCPCAAHLLLFHKANNSSHLNPWHLNLPVVLLNLPS